MSLRKAINKHCEQCVYDNAAPGTRLQQITLCSVKSCALYGVRPKTAKVIPQSVLSYYGVNSGTFQPLNGTLKRDRGGVTCE